MEVLARNQDIIEQSLERAAEVMDDFSGSVYKRYFDLQPDAEDLMSHLDDIVRGKMVAEIIRLLFVEDYHEEADYLRFETKTHADSYFVKEDMYPDLLTAVVASVKEGAGDIWEASVAQAWQTKQEDLLAALRFHIEPS
jgi:hemoglobin-like flavoprotein